MDGYDERDWGTGMRMLAGAVGVARGLQDLEAGGEISENRLLDRMLKMRELEGPSPREKFAFEKEKYGSEQAKYVINAFTELAKTASPADGKVLEEHASRFMNLLSPAEREAVGMIWTQSKLNPGNKKGQWFDETTGGAPKVTADPSKDLYGYAVQMKNLKEWQRQKQGFVTGQVPPEEKLFGLADGVFAYTNSEGKVQVLSSEDLAMDQISKEYGVTKGELTASGGVVYGKDREIAIGGNLFRTRSVYNAVERKRLADEIVPVKGDGKLGVGEDALKDFAIAFSNKDDSGKTEGSKAYLELVRLLDSVPMKDAMQRMSMRYPGYNFRILDPGTVSSWPIWGGYAPSDTDTLVYWRGEQVPVKTKDGKMLGYYYDHPSQRVYDDSGRVVANSLVDWQEYIGGMTLDEVKGAVGKAPEKKTAVVTKAPVAGGEVKVTGGEDREEIARQARFDAQTEKIKENIATALKALSELTSGPGIPRVR